jgi:ATP-binding cassette subfamily F protein uup
MPPSVLLTLRDVSKAFGSRPVFSGLSLTLAAGDRVGLIGPNGAGKSTLLRLIAGQLEPDSGERVARKGLRVGYVVQEPAFPRGLTVEEVVRGAVAAGGVGELEVERRIAVALGTAGFTARDAAADTLSGGWRKRLAIACALAAEPDILLFDEPTNHLDLEGILWLEEVLGATPQAFVVVSHDRTFLDRVPRRMLELDRRYPEGLFAVDGAYAEFLEARDERLRSDEVYRTTLANLVRREVAWLRRGAKARTTKAKARIDTAMALQDELAAAEDRAAAGATAGIALAATGRKTKRLWKGEGLVKHWGDRPVVAGLDLELLAGTRLGILGPNGSGKTTLLRLIAGEIAPDGGTIQRAEQLRVSYFQQHRDTLDPTLPLSRALAPEGDHVHYAGKPIHVAGWAARFLFRADQLRTPVGSLSGGERARVGIARLMLRPADLLVLDEPTNDLDIPTLDVLEEALLELPGALVLVTHDRLLLDRVTTGVLALDGSGGAARYADVEQWQEAREAAAAEERSAARARASAATGSAAGKAAKKLSWKEAREWEGIEAAVAVAEDAVAVAEAALADPAIATDAAALQERLAAAQAARAEVDRLYARWAELEEKRR